MDKQSRGYLAYLIRLWQTETSGRLVWRVSLEEPHSDQRLGFADLESVFAFLKEQTDRQGKDPWETNSQPRKG